MVQCAYVTVLLLTTSLLVQSVISACSPSCHSCDEYGQCTSCIDGNWGVNAGCQYKCNAACFNRICNDTNGYCNKCNAGFYGSGCQFSCSLCEEGLCDLRVCTKGCKPEYYEYKTTSDTVCWSCSGGCRFCTNNTVCSVCNDGFYLYKYERNERTFVQCIPCQQGAACSSYCAIQNCKQCTVQSDSVLCTECIDGYRFNDDICIPNESNCAQGCSSDCDETGICLGSCNSGWTGERCSDSCATGCLKCYKNNTNVCLECKDDYYTVTCDVECSPSCIKMSGKQTCRLNDGQCLNGCESNLWGQYCNQSCSNGCVIDGVSRVCERHSGTCKNGCTEGFTGGKCETTVTRKSITQSDAESSTIKRNFQTENHVTSTTSITTQSEASLHCQCEVNSDKDTHFAIGYVSGLGTAAFIVAVTAALYHVRRRYISRKSKTSEDCTVNTDMSTYYNEAVVHAVATERTDNNPSNYESLGNNRNTDTVYSELERLEAQQSHKYYNVDIPK